MDKRISNETINYYNSNSKSYINNTASAQMGVILREFLQNVPQHEKSILDLGCGSGRDSLRFIKEGYSVVLVDGSSEMCKEASRITGQKVILAKFEDYTPQQLFGGIWANASLLHLSDEDIRDVVGKLAHYLVADGCFYMSFKLGHFSGVRDGRFFNDFTEERLTSLLQGIYMLEPIRFFVSCDVRKERSNEKWINAMFRRRYE